MFLLIGSLLIILASLKTHEAILLQNAWDYNILSAHSNTSDPNLVDLDLRFERTGRSGGGISGFVDIKIDITDDYTYEMKLLRSATGTSTYLPAPLSLSPIPWPTFVNTFYKNLAMETLKNCSNAPQFEGRWEGPIPKKRYELRRCIINPTNLPSFMPQGYYKAQFIVKGPEVKVGFELLAKLEYIK